jgi:mRNA-degrading endonuclease toxin of MazEF toxin-antitoxin module
VATAICAPVYGEVLGLRSEVVVGVEDGVPRQSTIRCDFLALLFKTKLTGFVGTLSTAKQNELRQALTYALQLKP